MNEEQLFAMTAIAREQQAAAQKAIDGLADLSAKTTSAVRSEMRSEMQALKAETIDAFSSHRAALKKAVEAAHGATKEIQENTRGLSRKIALVASMAVLAAILVSAGAAYGMVAWQGYQVRSLIEQRAGLEAEISKLQATAADFSKRAGKAQLSTCGESRRLCVKIDAKAGFFGMDYAVINGY